MTTRSRPLLIIFKVWIGVLLFSNTQVLSVAWADVEPTDLKSDLELELEGAPAKKPKKTSHSEKRRPEHTVETPAPRPQVHRDLSEIDAKIEQAQKMFDAKNYDGVVNLLRPINDVMPRGGLLLLARAYSMKNDTLDEIRTLELCLAKNPKDYVVKTVYGQALIKIKRVEDGLTAFQEARQMNPRYKPAYEAMVKELEKKSERYEARNVVNDMIKVFGPQAEFFSALCRLYAIDGYNEKSVEVCQQAIGKDPNIPEDHVYLGLALKNREEIEKATSILSKAASRFPKSEAVQSALGELYVTKKDQVRAQQYYRAATKADPNSARAWVGYANTSFELQKNDEALKAYAKACKIDRTQLKDFREAIGRLRQRNEEQWRARFEFAITDCL
jgi:tetratricopeptide (TPR) repeat protein